jgi:hypothetical protein
MRSRQFPIWIFLAIVAIAIPVSGNGYYLSVGTTVLIFAVLAVGLNVVLGYAGLLDLGYVAFFAIGSYVTAMLLYYTELPFLLAFILSGITAGLFGMLVGAPTLRLRTDYLAIVTIGFGEIVRIVATNLDITGGPTGLYGLRQPVVGSYTITEPIAYYWIALGMLMVGLSFSAMIRRTKLGAAWAYIRYDEEVAQAAASIPSLSNSALTVSVRSGAASPEAFTLSRSERFRRLRLHSANRFSSSCRLCSAGRGRSWASSSEHCVSSRFPRRSEPQNLGVCSVSALR